VLLPALTNKEAALPVAQLIRMRGALARALSTNDVNELGRRTGQSKRLRTVTPHRLFLSTVAGLAGGQVESIADLLREFNHQNDVTVAYKAFEAGSRARALLLFKEWKSYANLHKFDTANEHIATGLIWASLCAAVLKRFLAHAAQFVSGKPISTRRVAMCAGHIIDEIVAALLSCVSIADAFRVGMAFLLANARRSNPRRDRKTGRLRSRLIVVGERT
jgi:hypothetical protein